MRDFNVDIEAIKIPISKEEYLRATTILNNAGRTQRIVRAVPYYEIHNAIKEHLHSKNLGFEDAVIVGVDRGGRIPARILREATGHDRAYFLKVDQGGRSVSPDLERLISDGTLKGKYIIFVDSTVDSGRQINALIPHFSGTKRIGHLGWVVVGSNEYGKNLGNHLNINWGLNPDESFEDNPSLMGVDYGNTNNTVRALPSTTSTAIRNTLKEVPQGIVLELSGLESLMKAREAFRYAAKVTNRGTWQKLIDKHTQNPHQPELLESGAIFDPLNVKVKKAVAIIGDGFRADISDDEALLIAKGMGQDFTVHTGTTKGNPAKVFTALAKKYPNSSRILFQPESSSLDPSTTGVTHELHFHGGNKREFRENLVAHSDVLLVLGGKGGTLNEALCGLYTGKQVVVIKNFGAVGEFLSKTAQLKKFENLHSVNSVMDAVQLVRNLASHGARTRQ
jgi:hypoxanthine phosphoribosyltransferase